MSFRIEDILRNNNTPPMLEEDTKSLQFSSEVSSASDFSTIQQSMLKNNFTPNYYRSFSDSEVTYYNWWNNTENFKLADNFFCNSYNQRGNWYANVYNRPWNYHYAPYINHCSKRKGGQIRFTTNQTETLEKKFMSQKFLTSEDRKVLAGALKLTDQQVKTWFQNRRAKWRKNRVSCPTEAEMEIQINHNSSQTILDLRKTDKNNVRSSK